MNELIERAKILVEKLDIEETRVRIREMKEMAALQKAIEDAEKLSQYIESNNTTGLSSLLSKMEVYLYFAGPYDKSNAILSIHAGQGGADAMDWAEMLKRMYARYFEKKDWKSEILDEN